DLEVVEGLLAPAQEGIALPVALELELGVAEDGAGAAELVDLDRVVDDELRREERVDLLRVAAEVAHRVPHRGEIDERRNAREVLEQHAGGAEGDLAARLLRGDPAGDGVDRVLVAVPQDVLEQDA